MSHHAFLSPSLVTIHKGEVLAVGKDRAALRTMLIV
jgi:hypothetical protein